MSLSSNDLWLNYATQIQQYAAPMFDATKQVFAFAGPTLLEDLANADAEITQATVYQIGNTIPAYSPSYSANGSLSQAFSLFLAWIDLGGDTNPNLQSQINIAAANVSAANINYNNQYVAAASAYTAYKTAAQSVGDTVLPFSTWVSQNYPVYGEAYNALLAAQSSYNQLMTQAYGAGYQQLQAAQNAVNPPYGALTVSSKVSPYNMVIKTGNVAPAGSTTVLPGQTAPSPSSTLVESYAPSYTFDSAFVTQFQQWQSNSVHNITNVKIVVTGDSGSSDWSNFGFSSHSSWSSGFPFFWFGASSSSTSTGNATAYDMTDMTMSIEIGFTGLNTFTIAPGTSWFNQSLIAGYGNQLLADAPQFFGDGGVMPLLPSQIVLGFEPTIKMTLDQSTYNSYKSQFSQTSHSAGGIGPFYWGSGNNSSYANTDNVSFSDSDYTITIGPIKSTLPILLGVICTKLEA